MSTTWILDVLADLRTFAKSNDLPVLADYLGDTTVVAMAELASKEDMGRPMPRWKHENVRKVSGKVRGSANS